MTTKEMKELYANGEWICVCIGFHLNEWVITNSPEWINIGTYKLIHKKHSEVLDHVLNGGKYKNEFFDDVGGIDLFIKHYHQNNEYEIIKDKPSLNGHYCLATKQHYDKLVEDGYMLAEGSLVYRYFYISDTGIIYGKLSLRKLYRLKAYAPTQQRMADWQLGA